MLYTPHFNLNLPEGTDIVNPLVQDNPNYTAIDAAMYANKQTVIGSATELTSGSAHAITRSNTDSNYFKFTATSNWTAGDTMTVDGTPVTVLMSDGTTPKTNVYVINTEVLILLSGTRATLIVSQSSIDSLPADQITFDNTGTGISASDVQNAIKAVNTLAASKMDASRIELTAVPETGMAPGWYIKLDLSFSWATNVAIWIQVASGDHVYVFAQNNIITLH